MDAFNSALDVYVRDSDAASVYFAKCADADEPTTCLAPYRDEYATMTEHQQAVLTASDALVSDVNAS